MCGDLVRKLAATLAGGVFGSSCLLREDEGGALAALKSARGAVVDPAIAPASSSPGPNPTETRREINAAQSASDSTTATSSSPSLEIQATVSRGHAGGAPQPRNQGMIGRENA